MLLSAYKRVCSVARYGLLAIFLVSISCAVSAQNKSQLEKEKAQLEKEIKKLNNDLAKAKKNTKLNTQQLKALNKKINERTRLIKNINSQVSLLDQQIVSTQDTIAKMNSQIDSVKAEYALVVRALYREQDNIDKMVLVLDSKSYNRSFLRRKYFNEYARYRRHLATVIKHQEEQMQEVSLSLQKQKSEKSALLAQEVKNKKQLSIEQQQKQRSVNASKQQEKKLTSQLSKKEKQKKQLQQQIQKLINEEITKSQKHTTTTPSTSGGGASNESPETRAFSEKKGMLNWPVYYKSVAREYGRYTHSSGGQNMNNGIDLITAPSTAVFAVAQGTVSRVFTCPNGSKGIIVRHGDYMSVYANMSSVNVKEGAKVNAKQTIGAVAMGSDGNGEFSFQLWKGTASQNPRNWLRR